MGGHGRSRCDVGRTVDVVMAGVVIVEVVVLLW